MSILNKIHRISIIIILGLFFVVYLIFTPIALFNIEDSSEIAFVIQGSFMLIFSALTLITFVKESKIYMTFALIMFIGEFLITIAYRIYFFTGVIFDIIDFFHLLFLTVPLLIIFIYYRKSLSNNEEQIIGEGNSEAEVVINQNIKKTPVILTIIYTLITGGIYYPCWFLTRRKQINKLQSDEKLSKGILIFAIVVYSLILCLYLVSGFFEGIGESYGDAGKFMIAKRFASFADFTHLFIWIIMVFQCFKVKRIFWDHFNKHLYKDVRFSELATFFFGAFYLQYKINNFY